MAVVGSLRCLLGGPTPSPYYGSPPWRADSNERVEDDGTAPNPSIWWFDPLRISKRGAQRLTTLLYGFLVGQSSTQQHLRTIEVHHRATWQTSERSACHTASLLEASCLMSLLSGPACPLDFRDRNICSERSSCLPPTVVVLYLDPS